MKPFTCLIKLLYCCVVLILLTRCDNIDDDAIILSKRVHLQNADFVENTVVLNWTEPNIRNLQGYYVMRSETKPGPIETQTVCGYWNGEYYCYETYDLSNRIASISSPGDHTYIDENVPISNELYYYIIAISDTFSVSNVVKVDIADVNIINLSPVDMDIDPSDENLYTLSNNKNYELEVHKINLASGEMVDSISLDYQASSSYIKFIETGSCKLICVWSYKYLWVIDANTMSLVSQKESTNRIEDVTCDDNGHVFVLTYYDISTYNANGFTLSSQVSLGCDGGMLYCFNNKLLRVEDDSYPDYNSFTVGANGALTSSGSGYLSGSSNYFRGAMSKPLGYIVSEYGIVYNFDLDKVGSLPFDPDYYSSSKSKIYCGQNSNDLVTWDYSDKQVCLYSLGSFSLRQNYPTLGYPKRAFITNSGMVFCVSSNINSSSNYSIFIEELN